MTDVLVTMNTPTDRGKLFKIIKMLYGLMGLPFSEEAEPMDADPDVLEYFIFSFTADFGEVMQELIAEEMRIATRTGGVSSLPHRENRNAAFFMPSCYAVGAKKALIYSGFAERVSDAARD